MSDASEHSHVNQTNEQAYFDALPPQAIQLPTDDEKQAYNLRTKQGLSDSQIADVLNVARETVNRRIRRFELKLKQLRRACAAGNSCTLLELVLG
ncbi:hypothetical protein BH09PLA1_BH09PLA1_26000 [soil metagenome]